MENEDYLTIYQIATEIDLSLAKTKKVLKEYIAYIPFKKDGRSTIYPLSSLKLILKISKLIIKYKNNEKVTEVLKKDGFEIINKVPEKIDNKPLPLLKRVQNIEKELTNNPTKNSSSNDILKELKSIKLQLEELKKVKKEVERLKTLIEG
ncbi:MAG: hypothetical protein COB02_16860 [Candidatus Cloacimonadota bacterium]|nr:MAG: hypothetical protein COB02_16860 [Candidatus Cloacimonadota bacterium]